MQHLCLRRQELHGLYDRIQLIQDERENRLWVDIPVPSINDIPKMQNKGASPGAELFHSYVSEFNPRTNASESEQKKVCGNSPTQHANQHLGETHLAQSSEGQLGTSECALVSQQTHR